MLSLWLEPCHLQEFEFVLSSYRVPCTPLARTRTNSSTLVQFSTLRKPSIFLHQINTLPCLSTLLTLSLHVAKFSDKYIGPVYCPCCLFHPAYIDTCSTSFRSMFHFLSFLIHKIHFLLSSAWVLHNPSILPPNSESWLCTLQSCVHFLSLSLSCWTVFALASVINPLSNIPPTFANSSAFSLPSVTYFSKYDISFLSLFCAIHLDTLHLPRDFFWDQKVQFFPYLDPQLSIASLRVDAFSYIAPAFAKSSAFSLPSVTNISNFVIFSFSFFVRWAFTCSTSTKIILFTNSCKSSQIFIHKSASPALGLMHLLSPLRNPSILPLLSTWTLPSLCGAPWHAPLPPQCLFLPDHVILPDF